MAWEPIRGLRNVRNFREGHLQRRIYANGESTVPRVKFMLREATVLAEALFPSWETAATAIVRNTSKRKKFYEIIVISVNNTKVCQWMRRGELEETGVTSIIKN